MDIAIDKTKKWIDRFVIKLNLCPFASKVVQDEKILYHKTEFKDAPAFILIFKSIIDEILGLETPETTGIIIIEHGLESFDAYLEVFYILEDYLEMHDLDIDIQLASFHPNYQFGDVSYADPSNATNRSPYPLIHLLRVADVEKAVQAYGDTSQIPINNISKLKEIGQEGIDELMNDMP